MSTAVDFNELVIVVDVENIDSDTDSINCIDNSNGQPLLLPSSVTSSTVHILHNAEETPIVGTTISSRSVYSYTKEELLILIGKIPIILNRLTVVENENTVLKDNFAKLQSESDAYKSEYIKLQHDFTALKQQSESEYKGLQSELTTFKVKCEGRHNDDAQYSRRNSLLLKKLRNVPKNCHGTNFSKFVASEINRLLPELSMSVTHHHIDASHPLNNENMNSPIVVKFVSRDLRNEIYNARNFITDPHVTISEHLTPQNHTLLTKAQDATSYEDAWSNQGKIYMKLEGSTKRVNSLSDIPPKATGSNHDASRYKRHRKSASTNYQKGRTFYKKAGNFPRLNYNNQSRYHHNRNSNNSYDNKL